MNKLKQDNRIENQASRTALMAAIHRFMASKEKDPGFVCPDNLAYVFLPPKAKFFLSFAFFRRIFRKKLHQKVPGTYEYVAARTKFFDEIFVQSVKEKIPQIVFLGAGFDTRAIRFQQLIKETLIFELDAPTTQREKKAMLTKQKVALPENLVFVSVNFNTDNLKEIMGSAGFDPEKKTLFIWEGVTMYVTKDAVNATLSFIKENSGPGSALVYDYFDQSVIDGTSTAYGANQLSKSASKLGEGFKFGIEEGKVQEFLDERGFDLVNHYSPEDFGEKYLRGRDGNVLGKMYGFAGHVYAKPKN